MGEWRYLPVDDFVKDIIRDKLFPGSDKEIILLDCELYQAFRNFSKVATKYQHRKIKDNELTFEDFFSKDLVEEWSCNFPSQSQRTYKILKFLDTLHPNKCLAFSVSYDESEDDDVVANVKAMS